MWPSRKDEAQQFQVADESFYVSIQKLPAMARSFPVVCSDLLYIYDRSRGLLSTKRGTPSIASVVIMAVVETKADQDDHISPPKANFMLDVHPTFLLTILPRRSCIWFISFVHPLELTSLLLRCSTYKNCGDSHVNFCDISSTATVTTQKRQVLLRRRWSSTAGFVKWPCVSSLLSLLLLFILHL